mmetsp:Transcript_125774/g.367581  ORF Transcript_125774/g.367581 Transcript_125774/m.367581 type:complete len:280 (+) Transcript_125774:15-854(+)
MEVAYAARDPGQRGRPPKGVQVRPEDLQTWLIAALQTRGEVAKADEVSRVDTTLPDIVARLKAIAGKEAWNEVVKSSAKGARASSRPGKASSKAGSSLPGGSHHLAKDSVAALAAPPSAAVPLNSCILKGVAPRIARRVRRRLAAPDAGGLLPLCGVGPGCPELLAGAMELWLKGALAACSSSVPAAAHPADRGAASPVAEQPGRQADLFPGAAEPTHGSSTEGSCVSVQHIARWLNIGSGDLPPPLRWPAGVRDACRADAERAELQGAAARRGALARG